MEVIEKEVKAEEADSWFQEYDKPNDNKDQLPIFEMKLKEGQLSRKENVVFLSDGKSLVTRFGATIVFDIRHDNTDKVWFIKKTQYGLLNPIAKLRKTGTLIGKEATVERIGSGAKETKWGLNFK